MKFSELFYFDENLRDVPRDPTVVQEYLSRLQAQVTEVQSVSERARIMTIVAGLHRTLMKLDDAETILEETIRLIEKERLALRLKVTASLVLAHTKQWKKEFEISNQMFEETIKLCTNDESLKDRLHLALQHHGKNLFDQKRYSEALHFFERALAIRKQIGNSEFIESTNLAIQRTTECLNSSDN